VKTVQKREPWVFVRSQTSGPDPACDAGRIVSGGAFGLKPGSTPVDRGKTLSNVTDGFAGAAPDLGAIELGQTAPHDGPRD
jgi:hypothetical protein